MGLTIFITHMVQFNFYFTYKQVFLSILEGMLLEFSLIVAIKKYTKKATVKLVSIFPARLSNKAKNLSMNVT